MIRWKRSAIVFDSQATKKITGLSLWISKLFTVNLSEILDWNLLHT